MAANRFGVDVASALQARENIKGSSIQNKMASLKLGEAERMIKDRPVKEEAANKRNLMIQGLRTKAVGGDKNAINQLLVLDSKDTDAFLKSLETQDETQKLETKNNADEMAKMSTWILDAKEENIATQRLGQVIKSLPEEQQGPAYDAFTNSGMTALEYADLSLRKSLDLKTLIENPEAAQVGGEDVVYQRGKEIERKTRPVKTGSGAGGTGSSDLKSGDESLMYRQAAELLGGMFDQAGNLQALDPETRTKAQAIATEATNLFRAGGITRTQAVANAAAKYGIEMPVQVGDNDPLGLR